MLPAETLILVFFFLQDGGKLISADQLHFARTNSRIYGLVKVQSAYEQFVNLVKFVKSTNVQFHEFTLNFRSHTLGDMYHFSALACVCAGKWIGSNRAALSYDSSNLENKSSGLTSHQIFNFLEASAGYGTPGRWSVSRVELQRKHTRHVAGRATQMLALLFNMDFDFTCKTITDGFLAAAGPIELGEEEFFQGVRKLFTSEPFLGRRKVLVWGREVGAPAPGGVDTRYRNSDADLIEHLCALVISLRMVPVLVGDTHARTKTEGCIDLRGFHSKPPFKDHPLSVPKQLHFIHRLRLLGDEGVCAQIGPKTGGMDGPALMCLPSVVLDLETNENFKLRMRNWHDSKMPYRVVNVVAPGEPGERKYDRHEINECKKELLFLIGSIEAQSEPLPRLLEPSTARKGRRGNRREKEATFSLNPASPERPSLPLDLVETLAKEFYGCDPAIIVDFVNFKKLDLSRCENADAAFDLLSAAEFSPSG